MSELKSISEIPSVNSTDQDWISWHKILQKETGLKNANLLFTKAWRQRKNEDKIFGSKANTNELRDYLDKKGVTLSGDGVFGFAYDVLDDVEDFASSWFNTGKWVMIIAALLIAIPAFILMMNVAKNPSVIASAIKPV